MATILIIDDDPGTRFLIRSLLETHFGHEVILAADGETGLVRYRRIQPDLLITDLIMPGLRGGILIEHLHNIYPNSRIIAISGSSEASQLLEKAVDAGAFAALKKPFDQQELFSVVKRALAIPNP